MRSLLKTCDLMRSVKTRDLVVADNGFRIKSPVSVQICDSDHSGRRLRISYAEPTMKSYAMAVRHGSSPEQKIALFRSLFRGRDDVYPRRFESRSSGKTGYSPVCANEWLTGICEKPRVKCATCHHRQFLPVTDDVIHRHLVGTDARGSDFVAGVYPMLLDETCFFLAIDLDKSTWRDDAGAVLETCRRLEVPAVLERSRSGNGGHIWIFFETAVPASIARRLGFHVLTETMERRPDIGLDSYDRFFPNQDTLPRGGFGNLIALPLQKRPREAGNSVFVDDALEPFDDQWSVLSSIQRMPRTAVDEIVHMAGQTGRIIGVRVASHDDDVEPWTLPPSRSRTDFNISGEITSSNGPNVERSGLRIEGELATRTAQSPAATGGISESRILQSPSDASFNLGQTANYRLR